MSDITTDQLIDALALVSSHDKDQSDKSSDKVIKPEVQVNPLITGTKRRFLYNFGTVIAQAFRDSQPDEKGVTKIAKATPAKKAVADVKLQDDSKKIKFGWTSTIITGLILLSAFLKEHLSPFTSWLFKTLPKFIKMLWRIATETKIISKITTKIIKFIKGFKFGDKLIDTVSNIIRSVSGFFDNIIKGIKGSKIAKFIKGGGMLMKVLKPVATKFGKRILKVLKFIPVIGGIVGLGFAIYRFATGDIIGGVFELISAILDFMPFGVTNIASMIIDGGLLLYDIYRVKQKETVKAGGKKVSFIKWIKDGLYKFYKTKLQHVYPFNTFKMLGQAGAAFKEGNILSGLKYLGLAVLNIAGGGIIPAGMQFITSLFSEKQPNKNNTYKKPSSSNIIGKIYNYIAQKIQDIFGGVQKWAFELFNNIGESISNTFAGVWGSIVSRVTEMFNSFKEKLASVGRWVSDIFKDLEVPSFDEFKTMINNLFQFGQDLFKKITDYLVNIAKRAKEKAKDIISYIPGLGWLKDNSKKDNIPKTTQSSNVNVVNNNVQYNKLAQKELKYIGHVLINISKILRAIHEFKKTSTDKVDTIANYFTNNNISTVKDKPTDPQKITPQTSEPQKITIPPIIVENKSFKEISKANRFLEAIEENSRISLVLLKTIGANKPTASIPTPQRPPKIASDNEHPSSPGIESLLDSRGDFYRSPYSLHVPGVID